MSGSDGETTSRAPGKGLSCARSNGGCGLHRAGRARRADHHGRVHAVPFCDALVDAGTVRGERLLAGAVLLLVGVARRRRMLDARQWLVLLVLLFPQWLASPLTAPALRSFPWLHETGWGVAFLLTLAAPLWLALLSALQVVSVQVPRAVVGATIAGIAAVCLVVPTEAYAVAPKQMPVLVLQLVLTILTVFTWTYAAPRRPAPGRLQWQDRTSF